MCIHYFKIPNESTDIDNMLLSYVMCELTNNTTYMYYNFVLLILEFIELVEVRSN